MYQGRRGMTAVLMHTLDHMYACGCGVQDILRPNEVRELMSSAHRPNYILLVLSELIEHTDIVTPERFRMDQNLTFLHDAHGACERLLKTPIPLSYTRSVADNEPFVLAAYAKLLTSHKKMSEMPCRV